MRSVVLQIAFLIFIAGPLQAQPDSQHLKLFSVAELQQDLDSLHIAVKGNHPDLWRHSDSLQTEKKWQEARSGITRPMKRWEFISIVSPLLNQYQDGHTYLTYFDFDLKEVSAMMEENINLFPWDIVLHDAVVWVAADMTGITGNARGLQIQSVNGVPVQKIIDDLMPLMAGDHTANKEASFSKFFSFFLWAHYGWQDKFNVTTYHVKRKQAAFCLEGLPAGSYMDIRFPKNDWTLQVDESSSLAIIECRNYRNEKAAKKFIDSAFAIISQKNIGHVAFDIRRNGGGNSAIGDYLLAHITDKQYADVVSKTIRDGSMIRKFKTGSWVDKMLVRFKQEGKQHGDLYNMQFGLHKPDSINFPKHKFNGRFYLLTGPATYSSAHMTAIAVKCHKLGTIIGQPTGEQVNLTGESLGYILPNTGLNASCATAVYKAACGGAGQMGVQPDILVPFSAKDLQTATDTVVEVLKQQIKQ